MRSEVAHGIGRPIEKKRFLVRSTVLDKVDGFIEFNLLRSKSNDTFTLFASHSVWKSSKDFENWTKSESFRLAHKNAGSTKDIYLGHPEFEGFEVRI